MTNLERRALPVDFDVAVIGGGFSGAMLVIELLRAAARPRAIALVESAPTVGRGLAYGLSCTRERLNSRASAMSVGEDRADFLNWLAARNVHDVFAPRVLFGEYVEQRFREAVRQRPGVVKLVQDRAVALGHEGEARRIALASGKAVLAKNVVLALGHQAPPIVASISPIAQSGRFWRSPWSRDAFENLDPEGDVALLGSGLTMVDAALSLAEAGHRGRIFAVSRRGLVPRVHGQSHVGILRRVLPSRLSAVVRALRERADAAQTEGGSWCDVVDELRPSLPALWGRLPTETQERFLRHARPWWDVHRHRLSPEVAARIEALRAQGQLQVLAAKIVDSQALPDAISLTLRHRSQQIPRELRVQRVINCLGPNGDVRRSTDPLIARLLKDGAARAHPTEIGFDVTECGALLDAKGVAAENMFALGPPTQGAFWEVIAVPEIRSRARALAETLAAKTRRRSPHQSLYNQQF